MEDYIRPLASLMDRNWLSEHILNLYRIERKQTFPAWQKAAKYTYDLLVKEGFDSHLLSFPADGVTTFQDKCTPLGWDVSTMRLRVVSGVPGFENKVIADYETEPLMAVKGSVSTPPGGITARLVTEAQMKAGEDVKGAFILLGQATRPRGAVLRMLLDLGAIGWVSDYLENPHTTPDSVAWINAGVEYNSWHVQAGDRDFISFQVTPRTGFALRDACEKGTVKVHAVSDGRRYETTLPAVTALLPGEDQREVWILSHLYEPLIDDNSNGVIGSIAILKALRTLAKENAIKLKYSVRVIFASEMYGFAAVADHFGGHLSDKVIGGINTDGILASTDKASTKILRAIEAPDEPGFAGNILLNAATRAFSAKYPSITIIKQDHQYGDDCFMSDQTIGIPTVWIHYGGKGGYHHNSFQNESIFDPDASAPHLAYVAEWVRSMAAMSPEEAETLLPDALANAKRILSDAVKQTVRCGTDHGARMAFLLTREKEKIRSLKLWTDSDLVEKTAMSLTAPEDISACEATDQPQDWYHYTENFVFERLTVGFPHDLVKLPREKRTPMPGTILYDTIADIFSRMDGKKTLKQLLTETEWDKGIVFEESTVRTYLHTCTKLADAGYLSMQITNPLSEKSLADALLALGVQEGETVLVHSALSGLGYLPGGADAVIGALRSVLGTSGTFMAPAFTRPYIGFGGTVSKRNYLPYDTRPDGALRDKNVYTGALPNAMLALPDAFRSGHATHEWVAVGGNAESCVSGHGLLDAPTGNTSPLRHALELDGSVIFLGCGIGSNTFIHYVEDCADAAYLMPGIIRYIDETGRTRTSLIERHLPGDRSFYHGADSNYYKEAVRRGLKIESVPFGMATLYRMKLRDIYDITMAMFADDPGATLCKDPDCEWCRQFDCI